MKHPQVPIVFVSGKYSGDFEENVRVAEELCIQVAALGAVPVCMITSLRSKRFMEVQEYEFWINAAFSLIDISWAVIFTHNYTESSGSQREKAYCQANLIPDFYNINQLRGWLEEERFGGSFP